MHVIIAAAGRGVGTGPGVRPAPGADEGKAGGVGGRCLNVASRFLRGVVSSPDTRLDEADPGSRGATRHDRWTDRTGTHPSPCGVLIERPHPKRLAHPKRQENSDQNASSSVNTSIKNALKRGHQRLLHMRRNGARKRALLRNAQHARSQQAIGQQCKLFDR